MQSRMIDYLEEYFLYLIGLVVYIFGTVWYLISLVNLNEDLLNQQRHGMNDVQLLLYKDYAAIKYFFLAALLVLIGGFMIWGAVYYIREAITMADIISFIVFILILVIFILLIIHHIMIPILKAIISVLFLGACILFASVDKLHN